MYGEPDVLRSRVDDLREQAADVRSMADHLVARTDAMGWTGRAAAAMRARVAERAGHLRAAAAEHDSAADALSHHAQQVELLQESIADAERRVGELVADARTRADADSPTEDDRLLLAFEAPPPGHRDWLDVELPGL